MTENLTAVRAALDTVIDHVTAHHNAPLIKALESVRHGIDAQEAQDKADYELGYAVLDQAEALGWNPAVPIATFGRIIRKAIEATGARIVTGDEQPEDVAQLRAERDRYRAWIQDVARRGTRYDPNPTTFSDVVARAGQLAEYIRMMHDTIRQAARDVLNGEGAEVADEQPVGELIGYRIVQRHPHIPEAWQLVRPDAFITRKPCRPEDGERAAAMYLLPKAVSGDE